MFTLQRQKKKNGREAERLYEWTQGRRYKLRSTRSPQISESACF